MNQQTIEEEPIKRPKINMALAIASVRLAFWDTYIRVLRKLLSLYD